MFVARRYLPSLSSLLAIEAIDRLGSASAAAEELSLTQSAISKQLRVMEEQLGASLIDRNGMRLSLTDAGREYVLVVRKILNQLSQASLKLKANPNGGNLNLSILPAFGVNWLAPRLPSFNARHPEVTVNLVTHLSSFDFEASVNHSAIHFGGRDWSGVNYQPIMDEYMAPYASPELMKKGESGGDVIFENTLLHLQSRADAWEQWLNTHKLSGSVQTGMLFDQFATMIQAAIHGMGIALLPTYLGDQQVKQKRLVRVFPDQKIHLGSYHLVWPPSAEDYYPLVVFRKWLAEHSDI